MNFMLLMLMLMCLSLKRDTQLTASRTCEHLINAHCLIFIALFILHQFILPQPILSLRQKIVLLACFRATLW